VSAGPLRIEAPTDAQLRYIRDLCRDNGYTHPDAICSRWEAEEIIEAMRAGTYNPAPYCFPFEDAQQPTTASSARSLIRILPDVLAVLICAFPFVCLATGWTL